MGLYRTTVPADGYWWGANYFTYGYETTIAVGSGTALVPQLDSTFTPLATFSHLARTLRPGTAAPMVQVPLVPGSVTQDNAAALATATRSYEQLMAQRYDTLVSSQLLALLNQVVSTQHTMEAIAAAIDVQLLLLAVFALYFVASRTSDEREPDVRLAELRGFRPRSVFGVALAEPLAITLTALPIGLVAAWILARATAPVLFPQGVGAPLTTLAVGTAVATAAVGLAAMAFGARRLVAAARSGGGAEARALQARSSAWRIVAEVAAIGLAAAAFAELLLVGVSGGGGSTHTDPLAALAPGILAVAVGVLGARLVPALTSATLPLTRNAPRVALVLATRRIARAGEFASQVVFVVLAVSLATFGIVGWKVAAYNRAVRSQFDVGADRVLAVQVRPGVNFLTAVRRADGGGRSAMAVMVENASDGVTLAVDSTRMAQVMSWPSGLSRESVAAVAKRLVPADLNPLVVLHGDQVALSITARVAATPLPQLSLDVMNDVYDTPGVIPLGTLHSGSQRYVGSTQGLCGSGCELNGIELSWSPPLGEASSPGQVHLTVTALADRIADSSFRVVPAGLADPHRWSAPDGGVRFAVPASARRPVLRSDWPHRWRSRPSVPSNWRLPMSRPNCRRSPPRRTRCRDQGTSSTWSDWTAPLCRDARSSRCRPCPTWAPPPTWSTWDWPSASSRDHRSMSPPRCGSAQRHGRPSSSASMRPASPSSVWIRPPGRPMPWPPRVSASPTPSSWWRRWPPPRWPSAPPPSSWRWRQDGGRPSWRP